MNRRTMPLDPTIADLCDDAAQWLVMVTFVGRARYGATAPESIAAILRDEKRRQAGVRAHARAAGIPRLHGNVQQRRAA